MQWVFKERKKLYNRRHTKIVYLLQSFSHLWKQPNQKEKRLGKEAKINITLHEPIKLNFTFYLLMFSELDLGWRSEYQTKQILIPKWE